MSAPSPVPPASGAPPDRARSNAARASVGVASALIVLKFAVAAFTGSLAILASALDSLLDLFASLVNWMVIRTAEAPPDREHPFGHGKAESLGGLAQAAVIGVSGAFIFAEAVGRLRAPVEVQRPAAAIAVMAVGMLASAWVVVRLRTAARATESPALLADSVHYLTDVYTNGGALVALVVVQLTGNALFDTLAAFGIAALVLWSALHVLVTSVNALMDRRLPDDVVAQIRRILERHPAVVGVHDMRARQAGADKFVQVHVEMDGGMTFEAAHAVAEELTAQIEGILTRATVIVHADPVQVDARGAVVARPGSEPPAVVPQD